MLKFGMQLETKQLIRFLRDRSFIALKASYWLYKIDWFEVQDEETFCFCLLTDINLEEKVLPSPHIHPPPQYSRYCAGNIALKTFNNNATKSK